MKNLTLALVALVFSLKITAQTATDSTVITAENFKTVKWETADLGDGLTWQHCHFSEKQLFNANENVHILRMPNGNPKLKLALASAADSLVETSKIAARLGAVAAVNGSFFDVKKGGAVDFIRIDGKIFDSTRISNKNLAEHQRSAIVVGQNGTLKIVHQTDTSDLKWAENLAEQNVMVTGPLLISEGKTVPLSKSPFSSNRHPRTCACVTDRDELILLTADGRTSDAYGLSLPELAFLLQQFGCRDAVNLDGGGSTTMWVSPLPSLRRGETGETGVVNMPCDNKKFDHEGERKVSNILVLLK